jgi:hypothetical protein
MAKAGFKPIVDQDTGTGHAIENRGDREPGLLRRHEILITTQRQGAGAAPGRAAGGPKNGKTQRLPD